MTASIAVPAYGVLLKRGDGAVSETFSIVPEVKDFGGPKQKMDTLDVTSHSPGGAAPTSYFREYMATLGEGGEVSFKMNWVPKNAVHLGLATDFANRTKRNFKIVMTDTQNSTYAFSAFVTGWEPDYPVAGILGCTITLKVSGAVTLS